MGVFRKREQVVVKEGAVHLPGKVVVAGDQVVIGCHPVLAHPALSSTYTGQVVQDGIRYHFNNGVLLKKETLG